MTMVQNLDVQAAARGVVRTMVAGLMLVSVAGLTGCVFGALDGEVDEALAAIDDTSLASASEIEGFMSKNWAGNEGSADISMRQGMLTIESKGRLEKARKDTLATWTFSFDAVDEEGYARFSFVEGRMCVGGSKDCNRDVGGSATARFIKSADTDRAVLIIAQINTHGDNGTIPFTNSRYSGTGEFIVHSWLTR
jgi:hypothetical protein